MNYRNFLPFLLKAFSKNHKTYNLIDKIYNTNKYEFYRFAKESSYYKHSTISDGDIMQEEYARKILGILEYQNLYQDQELLGEILKIASRGWPTTYHYVVSNNKVDFSRKLHKNEYEMILSEWTTELRIQFWLMHVLKKSPASKDCIRYKSLIVDFQSPSETLQSMDSMDNLSKKSIKQFRKETREIMNRPLPENYVDFITFEEIWPIEYLFKTENIDLESLLRYANMRNRDFDVIIETYLNQTDRNIDIFRFREYWAWAVWLKATLKSYKRVKAYYFQNNKETMYIEMESQEHQIEVLKSEKNGLIVQGDNLRKQISQIKQTEEKKYIDYIHKLEVEIKKLRDEISRGRENDVELKALREYVFTSQDNKDSFKPDEETSNINPESLPAGVICGGNERWQQNIKKLLPHFKFVNSENFDVRILDNINNIYINTLLSHSLYYKILNEVRRRGLNVTYIGVNEGLVLRQIHESIYHKNENR